MSKYIYWVKKDLFGCFRMEEIRDKDNETGLKEGRVIEMSTTVLSIYAIARSLSLLKYLPLLDAIESLSKSFSSLTSLTVGFV